MMKVLIISPCTLPVPAVKGGAVGQLIDTIISENEKYFQMELTVAGIWDYEAELASRQNTNTQFVFWKEPKFCKIIDDLYETIYKFTCGKTHRMLKLHTRKLFLIGKMKELLYSQEYDRVVFENMGFLLKILKDKKIANKYKGKCWYHVHNEIPNNIDVKLLKQTKLMLVSSYLGKNVERLCPNDNIKISVVKNGIDVNSFQDKLSEQQKQLLKEKYGISYSTQIIIFVGRIIPEKGVEETVDAFLNVMDSVNATLLIVGSLNFGLDRISDFEKKIKEKSEKSKGRIIFTGYIPHKEIPMYYQIADIALLPSMWDEPAGLTMLEAAASGVPVITTNVGGIPEYLNSDLAVFVEKNENIVTNISNAIIELLGDSNKRKMMSANAKKYVNMNFSETAFYNSVVNILREDAK